ncbi:MAG: DUF4093 domain-containing protein [Oscillospiraceae bacterium]|nr:DUF4093 domain-containing protein [Oscillospiraceae bacterium]
MLKINEVVVVEGKYDKSVLSSLVDAVVIETSGFGIFTDPQKLKLLRRLAAERGVIILTDSDAGGFAIRNYLKGALPEDKIKHAYIPEIYGKEKRKHVFGKEGKLGVEGMPPEILTRALKNAGALITELPETVGKSEKITKTDLFDAGLSGRAGSASKRAALLRELDLPQGLSTNAMLGVLNVIMSKAEFFTRFH